MVPSIQLSGLDKSGLQNFKTDRHLIVRDSLDALKIHPGQMLTAVFVESHGHELNISDETENQKW